MPDQTTSPTSAPLPTPEVVAAFVARWAASRASEHRVYQQFFAEFAVLLGVAPPDPAIEKQADYGFERPVRVVLQDGSAKDGRIDFYKRGCFVMEAKQGSEAGDEAVGTARRGTPGWEAAMRRAFGQARAYAVALPDDRPPFLFTVDIGHVFEVWTGFTPGAYGDYGARRTIRFADLARPETTAFFRAVFTNPLSLDPARQAARVTRDVAAHLAALARALEQAGQDPHAVARFLMACLFTMFAEDVGLLPHRLFTRALEEHWLPDPSQFPASVARLWNAMDLGLPFGVEDRLLRFNGGLFANPPVLPLSADHLRLLLEAARCDWSSVEPSIFGTLLERALDPAERQRLGAHFTPRAYIERLVRPTVIDPIRSEWEVVQVQVRQLVGDGTAASPADVAHAVRVLQDFHQGLCRLRILDPACGTGNFLYVTFDLLKQVEAEVLRELADLGQRQVGLEMSGVTVNPGQFLGIELNPRAREVAELVLWLGYLGWHRRTKGDVRPPEPVLQQYGNIECRDAVLAYSGTALRCDDQGRPVTVWDMRTYKVHPVTGKQVPDEAARVEVTDYLDPRPAEWPDADYVVGNPPFVGNWLMRSALGAGYTEALRAAWPGVPSTADLVMYWWEKAARLAREGRLRRFGFITTNSLTQVFNRCVLETHLDAEESPLKLAWAIPDHPWVDAGADVRIAMTVATRADRLAGKPLLGTVVHEDRETGHEGTARGVEMAFRIVDAIHCNLKVGADVTGTLSLRSNLGLCCPGVKLHGAGFIITLDQALAIGLGRVPGLETIIRQYRNGRDLAATPRGVMVIDLFGLDIEEVRTRFPTVYQWVYERVKPERDAKAGGTKDSDEYATYWWIFGKPRSDLRNAIAGLPRYIATPETAQRRWFVFLDAAILPDNRLICMAMNDAYYLGVLSSRQHVLWALTTGGTLEDRPVYTKSRCFDPFPLPDAPDAVKDRIRALAEQIQVHRERVRGNHRDATLTNQYAALDRWREALAGGPALTEKERAFHDAALTGVLASLHDDLDAAVADAYGWPADLPDDEILVRLVALNRERAAEEARGVVRWLRPEFQAPGAPEAREQVTLPGLEPIEAPDEGEEAALPPWPAEVPAQVRAIRDRVLACRAPVTADEVARGFVRAHRRTVQRHLEALEGLGILLAFEGPDGTRRWGGVRTWPPTTFNPLQPPALHGPYNPTVVSRSLAVPKL